jgi:hypothetical protein
VDIDYYNLGLTVRELRAELESMWKSGVLPEARSWAIDKTDGS